MDFFDRLYSKVHFFFELFFRYFIRLFFWRCFLPGKGFYICLFNNLLYYYKMEAVFMIFCSFGQWAGSCSMNRYKQRL